MNMSYLVKKGVLFAHMKNMFISQGAVRAAHWNKDWMPGPYPETPEMKAKAAKKYGLLPEEYKPYPDDGTGRGDYPNLEIISADSRDPYYPYDFPEHRRNFGQVMDANSDFNGEDRCDLNIESKLRYTKTQMVLGFLGMLGLFYGPYLLMDYVGFMASRPVLAQHDPSRGVHYKY